MTMTAGCRIKFLLCDVMIGKVDRCQLVFVVAVYHG